MRCKWRLKSTVSELRTLDYAAQMVESAQNASAYLDGYSREDFIADKRTQHATVFNLFLIGELAGKILSSDPTFA